MKILFAIQATGNGHLSRAKEIVPHLLEYGDVDLFVSGNQSDVSFPYELKYKKHGLSFIFGETGGINAFKTLKNIKPLRLITDMATLKVGDYDIIINDFEPVTAWACKIKGRKCVSLSHQASFLSTNVPRPYYKSNMGEWILKYYAPVSDFTGLHFEAYDECIETPVIRKDIRNLTPTVEDHIVVYLPAYSDEILIEHFQKIRSTQFVVFSKKASTAFESNNVKVHPAGSKLWEDKFASSRGAIMGAGFEGPSEAIHMGKKLLVIPMLDQYEQLCNSVALQKMGVMVVNEITSSFANTIRYWLKYDKTIKKDFPDNARRVVERTLALA